MAAYQDYFTWKKQVGEYAVNNKLYHEQIQELQTLKEKAVNAGYTSFELLETRNIIIEYLKNSDILIMEDHWSETTLDSELSLLGKAEEMAEFLNWLFQKISPAMIIKQLKITSNQEGVSLDLVYILRDGAWLRAPGDHEKDNNKLLSFIREKSIQATSSESYSYQYQNYHKKEEGDYSRYEIEPKVYKKPDYITWLGYYQTSNQTYFLLKVYEEVILMSPGDKKTMGELACSLLLMPEPILKIENRLYNIKE